MQTPIKIWSMWLRAIYFDSFSCTLYGLGRSWIGGEDYGTNLHTEYKSVHALKVRTK